MAVNAAQIEALDNETMNARCVALINRYWARQGVVIELSGGQGRHFGPTCTPTVCHRVIVAKTRSR